MKVVPFWLTALLLCAAGGANAQESSPPRDTPALGRLELRPNAGWAFVPNSVTGPFAAVDIAFRLGRAVALGLDLAAYSPFNRGPGAQPSYPLNETRDSLDLDVSFYPWPAGAGLDAAGSFEPYLLVGLGAVQTRPIPVVDPADRSFDQYNTQVDMSLGAGLRVFVAERLALTLELRDLLYFEKIENAAIVTSFGSMGPHNPAAWYDPSTHLTNAIQIRLGVGFFILGR